MGVDRHCSCLATTPQMRAVMGGAVQGWSVYIHTGASAQKYNQDSFQPQRWLAQGNVRSKGSPASAQEHATSSTGQDRGTEGSSAAERDAAAPVQAAAGLAQSGCPEHSLPFGLGPRMCLGRHIVKAALIMLVTELVSKHEWQMGDPHEQWSVFPAVRPKGGLFVCNFTEL